MNTILFEGQSFLDKVTLILYLLSYAKITSQIRKQSKTCRNPLKGAKPVPGPTMIIGVKGSTGNLKFDGLIKIGAQLELWLFSKETAF